MNYSEKEFGTRIKNLRKERNLRQQYVADQVGISRNTLSHVENGDKFPSMEVVINLSSLFEVPIGMLLGEYVIKTERVRDYSNERL